MGKVSLPISNEGKGRRLKCPACGEIFWTTNGMAKWCVFCRDIMMTRQRREHQVRYNARKRAERLSVAVAV